MHITHESSILSTPYDLCTEPGVSPEYVQVWLKTNQKRLLSSPSYNVPLEKHVAVGANASDPVGHSVTEASSRGWRPPHTFTLLTP